MFTEERKKEVIKGETASHNSGVVRNKYGTGIRSFLVNSGFDNEKIAYDNENNKVTYDGKAIISPNIVVDGTSYADEKSLRTLALDMHKQNGKELVPAGSYVSGKTGIKNAAAVSDGYVGIGDTFIKPVVVSEGTAYITKQEADDAVSKYLEDIGYRSENDITKEWKNKYEDKINESLEALLEDEWSYNPEEDPAFLAYRDMYEREGKRAYAEAFGDYIANTNGYANSAAITAANAGLNQYMEGLFDKVPELMADDYERFSDSREETLSAVKELVEFADGVYDKEYKANSDYIDRISESNEKDHEVRVLGEEIERENKESNADLYDSYINSELDLIDLNYKDDMYDLEISETTLNGIIDRLYKEALTESKKQDALKTIIERIILQTRGTLR